VVIGLMLATGWILAVEVPGRAHLLLTAGTAVLAWRTRVHLLWLIGAGALLGALGLV
jgi:chromate transporter